MNEKEILNNENLIEQKTTSDKLREAQNLSKFIMTEEELAKQVKKQKIFRVIRLILIYTFLIILAFVMVFPFYWMLNSSLKTIDEYYAATPTFWPKEIVFSNYSNAWAAANFGRYMINTVIVGVISTALSMLVTVLAAFAFAKLEFKGRDLIFSLMLATMMIPGEMFTITNYQTVTLLGWKNSYTVLIVPFLVSTFYIYLLRQNFKQIPDSIYKAAKVDGTSDLKYLFKVMVPLAMPTVISIIILKMMGSWNSYVWPRLVANSDDMKLITNGLRTAFTSDEGRVDYPKQMAAVTIVSIPLMIIFICFRKYIMTGVSKTGTKG